MNLKISSLFIGKKYLLFILILVIISILWLKAKHWKMSLMSIDVYSTFALALFCWRPIVHLINKDHWNVNDCEVWHCKFFSHSVMPCCLKFIYITKRVILNLWQILNILMWAANNAITTSFCAVSGHPWGKMYLEFSLTVD